MTTSPADFLRAIADAAHGALRHEAVLRSIVSAALPAREEILTRIGFKAKFLTRTWGVMRRLGAKDPARDQLKTVFQQEMNVVRELLRECAALMPDDERFEFERRYLSIDGESFSQLLELLQDLAWIQNVRLDQRA